MTAADLISALHTATTEEAREITELLALMFAASATPHAVEQMRETLQIGGRYARKTLLDTVWTGGPGEAG